MSRNQARFLIKLGPTFPKQESTEGISTRAPFNAPRTRIDIDLHAFIQTTRSGNATSSTAEFAGIAYAYSDAVAAADSLHR